MGRLKFFQIILILSTLILLSTNAFAAMCPYDDFSGTFINSEKWDNMEFVREIQNGGLVSKIGTNSLLLRNKTNASNFNPFNSFQADINVVEVKIEPRNDGWAIGRAHFNAGFYNAQYASPSDATGDVAAVISIGEFINVGEVSDGLEARWYIVKFLDGSWENSEVVEWGSTGRSWEPKLRKILHYEDFLRLVTQSLYYFS